MIKCFTFLIIASIIRSCNLQRSEDDVSQFDTKFTKQIPIDSPDDSTLSESVNLIFEVSVFGMEFDQMLILCFDQAFLQ